MVTNRAALSGVTDATAIMQMQPSLTQVDCFESDQAIAYANTEWAL